MSDPVEPRRAATVVLLRDGARGVEVFLLRRVPAMAFAAGRTVFPGGSVDPADGDPATPWAGPPPDDPPVVAAAVRETFEETGVLLAAEPVDTSGPDWEVDRVASGEGRLTLSDLLLRRGLTVRADAVRPWSRWITPEGEPRRYDTYFFIARLPDGQSTRDVGGEAEEAMWARPADALADPAHSLMPPTLVTLRQIAEHDTVDSVLAAERGVEPVRPVIRGDEVVLPDGSVYPVP